MKRLFFRGFKTEWRFLPMLLLIGIVGFPGGAAAKDCPSTLQSHLHTTGNLSWGGELRLWSYYVDQYDYEERTRQDNAYTYVSGRGMAEFAVSDALYIGAEALVRNAEYANDDFECDYCADGFQVNVRQLWLDYMADAFTLYAGRDVLASGNQMVLDNFFDQVSVEFEVGKVSLWAGGGVLANDVAREATSCQRGAVYEYYPYWKRFLEAEWGDHRLGFAEARTSLLPKHYQQMLLVYTDSTLDDEQDSWIGDLYFNGAMAGGVRYFVELALQYYTQSQNTYAGTSLILSKNLSSGLGQHQLQGGLLMAQRDQAQRFAPLYESLWIGERYRYSLYQGDIFYLKHTLTFDQLEPVSLLTQYSQKFTGSPSDELDLGLHLAFSDKYRIFATYSALNLSGDYERTHQFQVHGRFIF